MGIWNCVESFSKRIILKIHKKPFPLFPPQRYFKMHTLEQIVIVLNIKIDFFFSVWCRNVNMQEMTSLGRNLFFLLTLFLSYSHTLPPGTSMFLFDFRIFFLLGVWFYWNNSNSWDEHLMTFYMSLLCVRVVCSITKSFFFCLFLFIYRVELLVCKSHGTSDEKNTVHFRNRLLYQEQRLVVAFVLPTGKIM